MKYTKTTIISIILLYFISVFGCASTHVMPSQTTWDRYIPSSLSMIKKEHQYLTSYHDCPAKFNFNLNGKATIQPYRISLIYIDAIREISLHHKDLIKHWGMAFKIDPNPEKLFLYELSFLEDSTQYWLPVQNQLIPFFKNELKKGDMVNLFIMAIGTLTYPEETDWVFIVNEFRK
jgi:hypothetical protein